MVERGPEKAGVGGSIPSLATTPSFLRISRYEGRALVRWSAAQWYCPWPSERPASAVICGSTIAVSRVAVLLYQLFLICVSNANPPFGSLVALTATRGET